MDIIKQSGDQSRIDLMALGKVLLKKIHYIILSMIICGAAFFIGAHLLLTPTYMAKVSLYVYNTNSPASTGNISATSLITAARLVRTYAAIISSDRVLEKVIDEAHLQDQITVEGLRNSMTVSAIDETEVFQVQVVHTDPRVAMWAANAVATIAPEQLTEIIQGGTAQVVDYAKLPTSIYSPSYLRYTAVGMLAGILLSAALIAMRAILDNTVKGVEEFNQWEYPLLATVPDLREAEDTRAGGYYGYGYGSGKRKRHVHAADKSASQE